MPKHLKILSVFIVFAHHLHAQLQVKNYFSVTGKKDVPVTIVAQDFSGYLWLGTNDGLYKFDGRKTIEVSREFTALKQHITAIFIDSKEIDI